MSKSGDGDGRRNNRPPVEHRIKPGEVRNPDGRRGKQPPQSITEIDRFLLAEAARIVSHDAQGEVTAAKRLVQEEFVAALFQKDPATRARLLKDISFIQAKVDEEQRHAFEFYVAGKEQSERLFRNAEARGVPPPDVVHPSHVHFIDGQFVFTGPLEQAERQAWEELKSYIKVCAFLHGQARDRFKENPSDKNFKELKRLEAHRRHLMRQVPKGWDWREEIYCRYSRTKFVEETIAWSRTHR